MTPNIIIAGAPKCGTTSVFDWLAEHPSICASSVKETYFLMDKDHLFSNPEEDYHKKGIGGYSAFFKNCDKRSSLLLEATPDYLYQKTALDVIGALDKSTRVIFILRKPSERVYSLFQFARNNMSVINKNISFQFFLEIIFSGDKQGIIKNKPILKDAIIHSQYVDFLTPWFEKMGGQVSIRLFEDMARDSKSFMMNLANELGIDNGFFSEFDFAAKNHSYSVKSQELHLFKKRLSTLLPDGRVRQLLRGAYFRLNISPSPAKTSADKDSIAMLDRYFVEFNDRLEALSGLDLSLWKGTSL